MEKLQTAINKFKNKHNLNLNYNAPINEFLLDCYLNCDPSSYGSYIQKKIEHDCRNNKIDVVSLSPKENKGDFEIISRYYHSLLIKSRIGCLPDDDYKEPVANFEVKCSFLGKTDGYTIRNIRPYQKIYGGYIICLVDCDNNFREEFHLVKYETLSYIFNMSHMNGTASQHKSDGFKNYGISFKRNSYEHNLLREYSELDGDSIEDLFSYMKMCQKNLTDTIMNSPEIIKFCKGLVFRYGESYRPWVYNNPYIQGKNFIVDEHRDIINNVITTLKVKYTRLFDVILTYNFGWFYDIVFYISGLEDNKKHFKEVRDEFEKEFIKQWETRQNN